ncbi:MAG TPA: protein translocase subunit SecF [Thermoanaerobaculia bacterium]|jgi:preprotein translocase subunit SecF
MQIFTNPNYDFVKWRIHAMVISLIFIGVGVAVFAMKGVNLGIDFAGGANVILKFQQQVPIAQLRTDLPAATIQQYGKATENEVLIRLPKQETEGDYAQAVVDKLHASMNPQGAGKLDLNFVGSDRIGALLRERDPDTRGANEAATGYYRDVAQRIIDKRSEVGVFTSMQQVTSTPGLSAGAVRVLSEGSYLGKFNVLNQETVGPKVGQELQGKAFWVLVLSTLAMGIYIWLRFDLSFGVAAMICIFHDVLIAMTFLVLMRLEFSLNVVAALLTIVGYSVNDTVVLYDRVRENKRKIKKPMSNAEHLNLAMNQTLSRTILTAGTVFLVLLALLAFGGEVIRGFSWILTIGVVSGTYSTLLIVPLVALALDRWSSKRRPAPAERRATDVAPREELRKRKVS